MKKLKVTIVIAFSAIVLCSIYYIYINCKQAEQRVATYEEAQVIAASGDYAAALSKFKEIEEYQYKDTRAWILFCKSCISYEEGDIERAHRNYYSIKFQSLTEEQEDMINQVMQEIKLQYNQFCEQQRLERQKEYEEKVRSGVPFIGMSEKDIDKTILGTPDLKVVRSQESRSGQEYSVTMYDFTRRGEIIFSVICEKGKVIQAWDKRDNPEQPRTSRKTSSSSRRYYSDPYNVDDYDDPEDFYYDYEDDFDGYEDAEDYWYDHREGN